MEPKILSMKVWEIGKEPVFYGYDNEDSVYSILDREIVKKPSHLNLITSRDLEPKDLSGVILHNQVPSEDFDSLKACGLVPPELEALFQKIQDLQKQLAALKTEKSLPEESEEDVPLNKTAVEALVNIVKNGILGSGEAVFDQIMNSCHDLTEQEKKILKLVGSHFSIDTSNLP